jgi:hypothetical protein
VVVGLTIARDMVRLVTHMGTKYYNYMMMMTTHTAPSILVNVSDCEENDMAWGYGTINIKTHNTQDDAETVREAMRTLAALVADNTDYDIEIELVGVED